MFAKTLDIAGFDPELAKAIQGERQRQEDHVELIASENYASPRVLEAQGSVLTNKYAEGYPGEETVWCRLRQRAAAFGVAGECCGLLCPGSAG
jgi:hypothetical protein